MAQLTQLHTVVCVDAEEFAACVARLDAYQANPSNPPLSSRTDDAGTLTVIYESISEISFD